MSNYREKSYISVLMGNIAKFVAAPIAIFFTVGLLAPALISPIAMIIGIGGMAVVGTPLCLIKSCFDGGASLSEDSQEFNRQEALKRENEQPDARRDLLERENNSSRFRGEILRKRSEGSKNLENVR